MSSLNSIGQSVFELESGNENVDRQTDGHVNLIGGLVTRNPPKNAGTLPIGTFAQSKLYPQQSHR